MIVTLLTDFGTTDYFVAAMKGAILSRDERIAIVDITHEVPRHDVEAAAFQILAAFRSFPAGTVHTVVIDPGVGSARRAIVLSAARHLFVGPDNGVFDLVQRYADHGEVREISAPQARIGEVSRTFHGRDIFAPAAAALVTGLPFDQIGEPIADPIRLPPTLRTEGTPGEIVGRILNIDRFGNCVTSIRPADLPRGPARYRFEIGGRSIDRIYETYADAEPRTPFLILGSAGFLEVAIAQGSAASTLQIRRGQAIRAVGSP